MEKNVVASPRRSSTFILPSRPQSPRGAGGNSHHRLDHEPFISPLPTRFSDARVFIFPKRARANERHHAPAHHTHILSMVLLCAAGRTATTLTAGRAGLIASSNTSTRHTSRSPTCTHSQAAGSSTPSHLRHSRLLLRCLLLRRHHHRRTLHLHHHLHRSRRHHHRLRRFRLRCQPRADRPPATPGIPPPTTFHPRALRRQHPHRPPCDFT